MYYFYHLCSFAETGLKRSHLSGKVLFSTFLPSLAPCTRDMYRVILVTLGTWRWLRIILIASQRCCVIWGHATLRRDMAEKRLLNTHNLSAGIWTHMRKIWHN